MAPEIHVLRSLDDAARLADQWDDAAESRGSHSDLYDSFTWLRAWAAVALPEELSRIRIPVVLVEGRLAAALPLVPYRLGPWRIAGRGLRPRARPVFAGETPAPETVAALVEALRAAGIRSLTLEGIPARDPATALFRSALDDGGFRPRFREASRDCLAIVEGAWSDHAQRFANFARMVKNSANRARRLGPVTIDDHGGGSDDLRLGYQQYLDVHARSWKGPLREPGRTLRQELLTAAARRGWARLFVLRISNVPVAAHAWFQIGDVAISFSTVYDRALRVCGPGSFLSWEAHQAIFARRSPKVLDYLPGRGIQKDSLGPDSSPLHVLEATQGTLLAPLDRAGQVLQRGLEGALRRLPSRGRRASSPGSDETPIPSARPTRSSIEMGPVVPLALSPALELYLAVAGEHASVEGMKKTWGAGDAWFALGAGPQALVRKAPDGEGGATLRELVLPPGGADRAGALSALAVWVGSPETSFTSLTVRQPVLPLPGTVL